MDTWRGHWAVPAFYRQPRGIAKWETVLFFMYNLTNTKMLIKDHFLVK